MERDRSVDNTKKLPTGLSFCTGYGGLDSGIEAVVGPVRNLAYVEIEAYAIANLVDKMETGSMVPAPVWTNVKTFPAHIFRDCVDILSAGYPCQPFSAAGKRKGKEDPRHLWPYIARAISIIRPRICFFENVEGHISLGLREVLADLVGLGYRVENERGEPTWGIFSAEECGAPHRRKRVFILAESQMHDRWSLRRWNKTLGSGECGDELAYAGSIGSETRLPRPEPREKRETRKPYNGSSQRWPARPGEEQYEWEEPRVI